MTTTDTALLRKSERARLANEAAHDHTMQRKFELAFESRDLPGSRAANAEASDRGKFAALAIRNLDADFLHKRRIMLLRRAAAKVPRKQPWLKKLLWAIYRNGSDRRKTRAELGLSRTTYWRGFKILLKLNSVQQNQGSRGTSAART